MRLEAGATLNDLAQRLVAEYGRCPYVALVLPLDRIVTPWDFALPLASFVDAGLRPDGPQPQPQSESRSEFGGELAALQIAVLRPRCNSY